MQFSEAPVKAVTYRVPCYPQLTLGESLAAGKAYSTEPMSQNEGWNIRDGKERRPDRQGRRKSRVGKVRD